jgi:hypothetical protein
MPSKEVGRMPREPYSPECVERLFDNSLKSLSIVGLWWLRRRNEGFFTPFCPFVGPQLLTILIYQTVSEKLSKNY